MPISTRHSIKLNHHKGHNIVTSLNHHILLQHQHHHQVKHSPGLFLCYFFFPLSHIYAMSRVLVDSFEHNETPLSTLLTLFLIICPFRLSIISSITLAMKSNL